LAILCALLGIGRPLGRNELVQITSYSPGAVSTGLQRLEFLGLVAATSRYSGYLPTSAARQLPFAMSADVARTDGAALETDFEVQKKSLASSSSSLSLSVSENSLSDSETTPTNCEVQKKNLDAEEAQDVDADVEDAIALLVETGCPERTAKHTGARDSVEAALAGGWTGAETYDAILGWFWFADYNPKGHWISHKGFLAGARIARLEAPPEEDQESRTRRYMAEALEQEASNG
jgi:hypothetical protein